MEPKDTTPKWSYAQFIATQLWLAAQAEDNATQSKEALEASLAILPPKLCRNVKKYLRKSALESQEFVQVVLKLTNPYREEQCPGCGREPGDGINPTCSHPMGCGFWSKN